MTVTLADKVWSVAFVLAAVLALVVYAGFVEPWLRRREQARTAKAYAERVSCDVAKSVLGDAYWRIHPIEYVDDGPPLESSLFDDPQRLREAWRAVIESVQWTDEDLSRATKLLAEMSHPHQPMPGLAYDPEVRP